MTWLKDIIRKLTIEQWLIIDKEYIKFEAKTNLKCIGSIILITLILIIQRYYGQSRTFMNTFGNFVADLPMTWVWSRLYSTSMSLILYVAIPYLFIRLVFKERIRDHGLTLKGIARYTPMYLIMLLVMLPLLVGVSFSKSFLQQYPLFSGAGDSWLNLLIWEANYGLYFIALEFFFRGFMLFALARYLGSYAIFVMVIPYVMIHFGKPTAETIGSVIAGIALGTLALRTRSIFGGVFIHVAVAWGMDILALLQKGKLQALFFK
jgi:membrane protease YdiL (CAAX protease family)